MGFSRTPSISCLWNNGADNAVFQVTSGSSTHVWFVRWKAAHAYCYTFVQTAGCLNGGLHTITIIQLYYSLCCISSSLLNRALEMTYNSLTFFDTWWTYKILKLCPAWESNRFMLVNKSPRILYNPKVHYRIRRRASPVSILSQIQSSPCPHPISWRSILILSSHQRLGLPNGLFHPGFPTKTLYTSPRSPHVLHAPPISFFSIWPPE